MPIPKTLYVLADGARARLVERSPQTGHFVTFVEIDARERLDQLRRELRASPAVRNRQSGTSQRHTVGREDFFRQSKEAFIAEVVDRAVDVARERDFQSIFVAAPARLIGPIRERIAGRATLAGVLERDLTKSPDAALPKWLDHVFSA